MEHTTEQIRQYILGSIEEHPKDIVAQAMQEFDITRPAIHKHIKELIAEKKIRKEGTTRASQYFLVKEENLSWKIKVKSDLQEDEVWSDKLAPNLTGLRSNIHDICLYGFTEMMNNVIDHSEAKHSRVSLKVGSRKIEIGIVDDGIGIFKKVQNALELPEIRESILHLTKGKFTTDSERHTGEGIFFTSRALDEFSITSGELIYTRISREQSDWFIQSVRGGPVRGTQIDMVIDLDSEKKLDKIFKEYTDKDELSFSKTNMFVKMAQLKGEKYISRSQAKRLLLGLTKFKKIVLDFKRVTSVGQAFVDEVFRVFKNANPNIEIEYINANPDVKFMIQRGLRVKENI